MTNNFNVIRLQEYTPEVAAGIGQLMPSLSERLSDEPMDEQLLREIIESPYHDQFIAQLDERIVGAATLSVIMGPANGKQAWLNDMVSDPNVKGVGSTLWDGIHQRLDELGIAKLNFTSRLDRIAAHHFYAQKGAIIRDADAYTKDFSQD